MAKAKGTPKTGGRKAGTPNRINRDVRLWVFDVIQSNMDALETDIQGLEPKERWAIIERLLPYILSKRQEGSRVFYTWEFPDGEFDDVSI